MNVQYITIHISNIHYIPQLDRILQKISGGKLQRYCSEIKKYNKNLNSYNFSQNKGFEISKRRLLREMKGLPGI